MFLSQTIAESFTMASVGMDKHRNAHDKLTVELTVHIQPLNEPIK